MLSDGGYCRNTSCALNYISKFFLLSVMIQTMKKTQIRKGTGFNGVQFDK